MMESTIQQDNLAISSSSSRKARNEVEEMVLGGELPDDLVADVLRRLPPHTLAVSRCVCRAWHDVVDARRLLRADLLPRSVGGIFINYCMMYSPEFMARPTTGPSISGDFDFIPGFFEVMDHCNGLVLCTSGDHDYVSNPATRQWARLSLPPEPYSYSHREMSERRLRQIKCLVYDPTVSPHYNVFLIQYSFHQYEHKPVLEPAGQKQLQVCVYSSETGCWEERSFAPEGRVVETTTTIVFIAEKKLYWRGALYLVCKVGTDFFMRISISNAKYTLIPSPDVDFRHYGRFLLGRSEKGVYCAYHYRKLQIFLLNESCVEIVWELRHNVDLSTFPRIGYSDQPKGSWILQDINYYKYPEGNDKHKEAVDDNFEWNSDDDNVLSIEVEGRHAGSTNLLGFHPYKEIVFLHADHWRAVAYHWNTSKFQDLGNIYPKDYLEDAGMWIGIDSSFIYTPCWMEDFPKKLSISAN